MVDALPLLQPAECALLLVDQQAGLAFGAGSKGELSVQRPRRPEHFS